jgi:hypothetical protein
MKGHSWTLEKGDAAPKMVHTRAITLSGSVLPLNGRLQNQEHHYDGFASRDDPHLRYRRRKGDAPDETERTSSGWR